MDFFGREDVMAQLDGLWGKRVSSLVTCRGRRRIGKSTLIERFAEKSRARFIKLEGLKPNGATTDEDERRSFAEQLSAQTGAERTCPANWLDAFVRLSREIDGKTKTVVLLDEVSWFAKFDRTFSATLKIAWDNHLKKHDRLVFVVCGSVSTWIKEEIVDNGAFYGRRSADIVVRELPLRECVKFWGRKAERLATREFVDVLSVTGGVPRYLEEVDPSLSAAENIRRMCFLPNAPLRTDFDEMFADVVTRQPRLSGLVLRKLVDGPKNVSEIAAAIGVEKGGDLSSSLAQLVESGMVALDAGLNPETGRPRRETRYRLKDNYSRFYLKFVEPVKRLIDDGAYAFAGMDRFAGWRTVMGLQFENLVVNNYHALLDKLHLGSALLTSAAPYIRHGSRKGGVGGCQIDLLLQTNLALCVVEIKRQDHIGREVIEEVREKVRRLPRSEGASVRAALIYDGELDPSVEADGYFDAIVSSRDLLGLR